MRVSPTRRVSINIPSISLNHTPTNYTEAVVGTHLLQATNIVLCVGHP